MKEIKICFYMMFLGVFGFMAIYLYDLKEDLHAIATREPVVVTNTVERAQVHEAYQLQGTRGTVDGNGKFAPLIAVTNLHPVLLNGDWIHQVAP